jgi:N-acetylmuramoyl-L-alanine amidase
VGIKYYTVSHIPKSAPHNRRPGIAMTPEYITIHSTGNPTSTAQNERGWLTNPANDRQASWHIVIDEKEAIEAMPLNEVAWHAGNATGNRTSIGIEICESGNRQKTLANAVLLVAKMLKERSWGVDKLRRHFDWSGKSCPRILMADSWQGWKDFIAAVEKELKSVQAAKVIVNGKECEAVIIEGKTYVEVRKPFELAGFKVNFNPQTKITEIVK